MSNTAKKKAAPEGTAKKERMDNAAPTQAQPPTAIKTERPKVALTDIVEVQSCFYGGLVYVSKKSGYTIQWHEFGESQYITVDELLAMRNSQPAFFQNQWVRLVGDNAPDVMKFLQLERYYKNFNITDNFDEIFDYELDAMKETISLMSAGMKETVARRAFVLIRDGALDSVKKIQIIEDATGFELTE